MRSSRKGEAHGRRETEVSEDRRDGNEHTYMEHCEEEDQKAAEVVHFL